MYRRRSQHNIFAPVSLDVSKPAEMKIPLENGVKLEPKVLTNGVQDLVQVKKEVLGGEEGDIKASATEPDFLSADGLKASLADLDNMFEDSDSEMHDASGCVPTPPASVPPHISPEEEQGFTKVVKRDPPGNLPSDQLHQMFPTPPSHEHPSLHSPGDGGEEPRTPGSNIKQEPASPRPDYPVYSSYEPQHRADQPLQSEGDTYFDHTVMLATSKFAPLPLSSLPSHHLPTLPLPDIWRYKPSPTLPPSPQPSNTQPSNPQAR